MATVKVGQTYKDNDPRLVRPRLGVVKAITADGKVALYWPATNRVTLVDSTRLTTDASGFGYSLVR
jgi:hypothetical protein